jgi:hypothetical protein
MGFLETVLQPLIQVIHILVYLCLIVFFFNKKTILDRILFLIVVAGIFFLVNASIGNYSNFFFTSDWTFTFTEMVIISWLLVAGIPFILKRTTVSILLVIYFASLYTHTPWSQIIGSVTYITVSYGFIRSAWNLLFPPPINEAAFSNP